MAATEHRYGFEIVEEDPRADQPELVKAVLKPHQLAALEKARLMECNGAVKYSVPNPENYIMNRNRHAPVCRGNFVVRTNIGILGDIVGYGKTLTALALVASVPTGNIHTISEKTYSYYSTRSRSYMHIDCEIPEDVDERKLFGTTLVIVPRGPVYTQWEECIGKSTALRCLTIDDIRAIKKKCPPVGSTNKRLMEFFNDYDIVLAKDTSIHKLIDYYNVPFRINPIRGFDRIMIDEAHDILSKSVALEYRFVWMITASYKRGYSHGGQPAPLCQG